MNSGLWVTVAILLAQILTITLGVWTSRRHTTKSDPAVCAHEVTDYSPTEDVNICRSCGKRIMEG